MNITDLLDEYDVPYEAEGKYCRPGWVQMHCPFCGGGRDPNKPYLGYNLFGGYCNCWICGPHSLASVLVELAGVNWSKAKEIVAAVERDLPLPDLDRPRGVLKIPSCVGPLLRAHRRYLRTRSFNPSRLARMWGVQGIGIAPRLQWRLFIPITLRGKTVSWTTRLIDDADPARRYVSAGPGEESLPHKELLYGEDYCRHAVIVVEGPFPAWRIGPGAVALLGTGYTPAQVRRISRFPLRVICLDNEPAAQERAQRLCHDLAPFHQGRTLNVRLDAPQPDQATAREIRKLRQLFLED